MIIDPYHWNWKSGLFAPVFWVGISVGQSVLGGTVEASWKSHNLLFGRLLVP